MTAIITLIFSVFYVLFIHTFDTAKMLLLRKLFVLPINLISPTFSCTFSMLHLINLKFSQLISRPTSTPLLPFNTQLTFLCTSLLFLLPIAHNLKSSCNIMHNSLTDLGRTDVISFAKAYTHSQCPVFFFLLCVRSFCWDGSLPSLNMQISVAYTTLTS